MNYASVEISLLAALPAIILAVYIFIKDKVEKEPIGLLSILFFSGAAIYAPVHFVRKYLIQLFDAAFSGSIQHTVEGFAQYSNSGVEFAHKGLCVFVAIALIDELFKWILIFFVTRKNKNFNCLFDGLVYSCFVSLGFAAAENVVYAWMNGWDTLLLRSVSSVPAHLLFGIVTGYFYTIWHMYYIAKKEEKKLEQAGFISIDKPYKSSYWLVMSLVLPILAHGLYALTSVGENTKITSMIFYVLIFAVYVVCFIVVDKISDSDSTYKKKVVGLIKNKYPSVAENERAISLLTGEGEADE